MNLLHEKLVRAALKFSEESAIPPPQDTQTPYALIYNTREDFASNIRHVSMQWIEDISLRWLENLITTKLGYTEVPAWQSVMPLHQIQGDDIFLTLKTGGGKSSNMWIPILASRELGHKAIGICVVPTKDLMSNLVSTAATDIMLTLT